MSEENLVLSLDEDYEELSSAPYVVDDSEYASSTCDGKAALEYKRVGGDYGAQVFAINKSGNQRISVTYKVRFQYQGRWKEEFRIRKLHPGQKKSLGVTNWKHQRFYWSIVGCTECR